MRRSRSAMNVSHYSSSSSSSSSTGESAAPNNNKAAAGATVVSTSFSTSCSSADESSSASRAERHKYLMSLGGSPKSALEMQQQQQQQQTKRMIASSSSAAAVVSNLTPPKASPPQAGRGRSFSRPTTPVIGSSGKRQQSVRSRSRIRAPITTPELQLGGGGGGSNNNKGSAASTRSRHDTIIVASATKLPSSRAAAAVGMMAKNHHRTTGRNNNHPYPQGAASRGGGGGRTRSVSRTRSTKDGVVVMVGNASNLSASSMQELQLQQQPSSVSQRGRAAVPRSLLEDDDDNGGDKSFAELAARSSPSPIISHSQGYCYRRQVTKTAGAAITAASKSAFDVDFETRFPAASSADDDNGGTTSKLKIQGISEPKAPQRSSSPAKTTNTNPEIVVIQKNGQVIVKKVSTNGMEYQLYSERSTQTCSSPSQTRPFSSNANAKDNGMKKAGAVSKNSNSSTIDSSVEKKHVCRSSSSVRCNNKGGVRRILLEDD